MEHARQLGVDAVLASAHHNVGDVDAGDGFANEGPIFGVFELNCFGGFQLGRIGGQLAVGQAAFAGGMGHFAQ